ncbi:MAG: hypothetical protein ACLQG3_08685 [Terracidiphilus sp.]
MVVVPLEKKAKESEGALPGGLKNSANWIRIAAAGTLAASGTLLLTGKRRAGLVAAVSGTALVMLDQQEAIREWWEMLPGFLGELQDLLNKAQIAVDDVSEESQKLRKALGR